MSTLSLLLTKLSDEQGQSSVELAVVFPVMLAVALIALNSMWFLESSARFDRLAADSVVAFGIAPSSAASVDQSAYIREKLEESMEGVRFEEIQVVSRGCDGTQSDVIFTLAPIERTYECTLIYKPWPARFNISYMNGNFPLRMEHSKEITIAVYRTP